MDLSISSFVLSLIIVIILTFFLTYQYKFKKINKYFNHEYLILVYIFIFARLAFPFEWYWTITLPSKNLMPIFQDFLSTHLSFYPAITVGKLLIIIWCVGATIKLLLLLRKINLVNYLLNDANKPIKKKKIQHNYPFLTNSIKERILFTSNIDSPVLINVLNPSILIPDIDYTENEQKYILLHEIQHIKNYDLLSKIIVEFLVCIYWWFPPMYILKKQLDFLIEVRVDNQVTKNLCESEKLDYIDALISVKKKSTCKDHGSFFLVENRFTYKRANLLTKRINLFFEKKPKKMHMTLVSVLFFLVLIPFFIFEPYDIDKEAKKNTIEFKETEASYIMEDTDGKFYFYENNKRIGKIKNPNEAPFNDLKIYKEKK